MPGKTSPDELPYAVKGDKPPSVEAITKAMSERNQALLPSGTKSDGRIVVVESGAPAYKAMSGDATIDKTGKLTIANDAVTAAKIAENAVGASEIAADAVGSSEIAAGAVGTSELATGLGALQWYTPSIIATEQSRTNEAFGTLTTADEIKEVVLPTNGLISVSYIGLVKASAAATVAIFIGNNQLKAGGSPQSATPTENGKWFHVSAGTSGLSAGAQNETPLGTTGETQGGSCVVFAAAGTYNIGIRFKCSEGGTVTAKERKLWVATLGL